jgi:hypothetical protein
VGGRWLPLEAEGKTNMTCTFNSDGNGFSFACSRGSHRKTALQITPGTEIDENKTIYAVRVDGRYPYASVLRPKATEPERYDGYVDVRELRADMESKGFASVSRVALQNEIWKRQTHSPEIVDLLKKHGELLGKDISQSFVYGSYNRPIDGLWASIGAVVYIQSDRWKTGYYTYVCVSQQLDKETIDRYELRFVSHA